MLWAPGFSYPIGGFALMAKKLFVLLFSVLTLLSLTACGGPVQSLPKLELPEDGEIVMSKIGRPNTLDGLCEYLAEGLAFAGDPVDMSYKEIGAVAGVRYRFTYNGSTVQVELYEFDLDNLDEKGKNCIDSVKENGKFTVLDNEVPAVLNEKYMMIYTDTSKKEENMAQKERVEQLFMDFAGAKTE